MRVSVVDYTRDGHCCFTWARFQHIADNIAYMKLALGGGSGKDGMDGRISLFLVDVLCHLYMSGIIWLELVWINCSSDEVLERRHVSRKVAAEYGLHLEALGSCSSFECSANRAWVVPVKFDQFTH